MSSGMSIDRVPLEDFNAKLVAFSPGPPALTNTINSGKNYSFPLFLGSELAPKQLTITVDVFGRDYHEAQVWLSRLISALNKGTELYLPDDFYYRAALTAISDFETTSPEIVTATLTFQAVRHTAMETVGIAQPESVLFYQGTAPAGYIIEFTAETDLAKVQINELAVMNIPAGATIRINGIEKTITQDGKNKFAETDFIDFPLLRPGPCKITVAPFVPLKLSYYPTYL